MNHGCIGPVLDQTGEVEYNRLSVSLGMFPPAQLTGFLFDSQAHAFVPGPPTYLKGSALTKSQYMPVKKAFDRLVELSENPEFDIVLGLEYVPLGNVMKIDPHSTDFVRRGFPVVLNVVLWKEKQPRKPGNCAGDIA
jgi:hypothetical protein